MAALPADQLQTRVQAGQLYAKYAAEVDPRSAHEIISERIAAARAAAGAAPGMTDAQIRAQQRQADEAMKRAEREAQARRDEAARRAEERERMRTERQREKIIGQVGTTVLRGVLGTLLGGRRR
jgi:hypothetical protein